MAILSKIRRWYFRDKLSIREIARRTGFSRNTFRSYLRPEILEPLYPHRQTPIKLDAFTDKLTQWLTDAARIALQSGQFHQSINQIQAQLRQHFGLEFSRGAISETQGRVSCMLNPTYQAIKQQVHQPHMFMRMKPGINEVENDDGCGWH